MMQHSQPDGRTHIIHHINFGQTIPRCRQANERAQQLVFHANHRVHQLPTHGLLQLLETYHQYSAAGNQESSQLPIQKTSSFTITSLQGDNYRQHVKHFSFRLQAKACMAPERKIEETMDHDTWMKFLD
jgi:hypothetical protein